MSDTRSRASRSSETPLSRRTLLAAFFGASAAAFIGNPLRAFGEPQASQETLDALSDAQEQYDAVQAQLDQIGNEYAALSEQQSQTLDQIEDTNNQIDDIQADIDEKEEELADKQQQLSSRLSDDYKAGEQGLLSVILASSSFDELTSNLYYVNKVNDRDQELISEVRAAREELARQKGELEAQKQELETLNAQQTEQLDQMRAKQQEATDALQGLSQQVQDLIAQRDAEILAAAQEEAEARRQAEEAARQAQQAASSSSSGSSGGSSSGSSSGGSAQSSAGTGSQQRVVNACYSTASPGLGLCAAWVSNVFRNAGLGFVGGNACDMYNAYCTSSNRSALKVGMIVAVSSHSHTSAGRIYGHIGIYVGNNTVMHNIGNIASWSLDQWCSFYGTTVSPRWGWLGGMVLS